MLYARTGDRGRGRTPVSHQYFRERGSGLRKECSIPGMEHRITLSELGTSQFTKALAADDTPLPFPTSQPFELSGGDEGQT